MMFARFQLCTLSYKDGDLLNSVITWHTLTQSNVYMWEICLQTNCLSTIVISLTRPYRELEL